MSVTREVIRAGDGVNFPQKGNTVVIHYTGTLTDGTVFASSRDGSDGGQPYQFQLGRGQVMKVWDDEVAKLSTGERVKLRCPPDQGYGSRGYGDLIPPNATLIFDVELLSFRTVF